MAALGALPVHLSMAGFGAGTTRRIAPTSLRIRSAHRLKRGQMRRVIAYKAFDAPFALLPVPPCASGVP
jgi:hypothetical protein